MSKKPFKMDPHLVSDEPYEIYYIAEKFGVKPATARAAKKKVGRSRKKIYRAIREGLGVV